MAMFDLQGRVALVTGGSKGLGAEIVALFTRLGADVAFTWSTDEAAAQSHVQRMEPSGRRCIAIRADAKDYLRAQEVVAETRDQLGGLHLLVCTPAPAGARPFGRWTRPIGTWSSTSA